MNTGQTMLAVGALVLMMVAAINANRLIVTADEQPIEVQHYKQAVALSEALFGEIRTKKFDHRVSDSVIVIDPNNFTAPALLGPEAGNEVDSCSVPDSTDYRSAQFYNDIDDYNRYVRVVRYYDDAVYRLSVRVFYINSNEAESNSAPTFFKKIIMTVASEADTVTFSTFHTY